MSTRAFTLCSVALCVLLRGNEIHAGDVHMVWVEFETPEGFVFEQNAAERTTDSYFKDMWIVGASQTFGSEWKSLIPRRLTVSGSSIELKSNGDMENPRVGFLLSVGKHTIAQFTVRDRYGKEYETRGMTTLQVTPRHEIIIIKLADLLKEVPTSSITTHDRFCLTDIPSKGCVEGELYGGTYQIAYKPGNYKKTGIKCTLDFDSTCDNFDRGRFTQVLGRCRDTTVTASCSKDMRGAVTGLVVSSRKSFGPEPMSVCKNGVCTQHQVGQHVKIDSGGLSYRFETIQK